MKKMKSALSGTLLLIMFTSAFLISCSTSGSIKSTKISQPIDINASLADWPVESKQRSVTEEFDLTVANDDEFLYLAITFKNNRTQAMVRDFGFRIFFDQSDSFRRSFGLIYPVGIVESIKDISGARKSYLENPGWRNQPENKSLVESLEQSMHERIQIISRTDRRDPIRPFPVNMEQLKANGIETAMQYDNRRMMIELKIPIRSSRTREFSVDDDGNKVFTLGFEIVAPDYEEITGERPTYETVDASQQGGYEQYGGRRQSRQELKVSDPRLYGLLNYNYQNWVEIRLDY